MITLFKIETPPFDQRGTRFLLHQYCAFTAVCINYCPSPHAFISFKLFTNCHIKNITAINHIIHIIAPSAILNVNTSLTLNINTTSNLVVDPLSALNLNPLSIRSLNSSSAPSIDQLSVPSINQSPAPCSNQLS